MSGSPYQTVCFSCSVAKYRNYVVLNSRSNCYLIKFKDNLLQVDASIMNQAYENVHHHTFISTDSFHYAVAQTNNSHENVSIKLFAFHANRNFYEIEADVGRFFVVFFRRWIKVHV